MTDDELAKLFFAIPEKQQAETRWTFLDAAPWQVEALQKVHRESDNPVRRRQVDAFRHEYELKR